MEFKRIDYNFYRYPGALQIDPKGTITDPAVQLAITVGVTPQNRLARVLTGYCMAQWMDDRAAEEMDYFARGNFRTAGCRNCPIHQYATDNKVSTICGGLMGAKKRETRGPIWRSYSDGFGLTRIYTYHGQVVNNTDLLFNPTHREAQIALLSKASCITLPELSNLCNLLTSGQGSPTMPEYEQAVESI